MKFDLRILVIVTCLLLLGASAVVIVRNVKPNSSSSEILENISPRGIPTAGRVVAGLKLQIDSEGLSLLLPNCDATEWTDNFFIHLYTDGMRNKSPEDFVNMDFNLREEANKTSKNENGKSCLIFKSFKNFEVLAASMGQYSSPNGKCCDIIWSRFYVFDTSSSQK